ncbi:HAD family hydrolase [Alteribacter populi]|uniref:HAD family hydrolase n=1 Tax=Alteribacter populi TaxID=2011011 RepID=UPI000BBAD8E0|nr:HAD family hydrolase [Alteribacter populi]
MKAIIFDFDGTLADTLPVCYNAFQYVFKEFDGKDLSPEEIKRMFGPSETGIIKENLSHVNKEEAIENYYTKYLDNHTYLVMENEEIKELLVYLQDKGIKLGIVTGKAKRSLDISLRALQMEHFFDVIITGDDVTQAKPHPEGVAKALSSLGVGNDEAMFIGDSDADVEAGIRANVITVGVNWLPNYQAVEFTSQPNLHFTNVSVFLETLKAGKLYES